MNIRALTVQRGISTLAEQSHHLSALFSFSSRGRRNAVVGEVGDGSASGIPTRQGEEELEGGFLDDEDDNVWFEERDNVNNDDNEIIQEDRSFIRRDDVERAINM